MSIPVSTTNKNIKQKIAEKLKSGEYTLGNMIAPKQYKKLVITPEGNIEEQTFSVSGRHIPLAEIRQRLLNEHERKGLVREHSEEYFQDMSPEEVIDKLRNLGEYNDDEELTINEMKEKLISLTRKRHLIVWADHSSLMNHGHILLTVNCLYDPAFFYTAEEIKSRTRKDLDPESIVQEPHVYILARCRDTVVDQLCYIDGRVEDLAQLADKITSSQNVNITDKMRFFHGDHPAQAVEIGQQEGGQFPCSYCNAKACS